MQVKKKNLKYVLLYYTTKQIYIKSDFSYLFPEQICKCIKSRALVMTKKNLMMFNYLCCRDGQKFLNIDFSMYRYIGIWNIDLFFTSIITVKILRFLTIDVHRKNIDVFTKKKLHWKLLFLVRAKLQVSCSFFIVFCKKTSTHY